MSTQSLKASARPMRYQINITDKEDLGSRREVISRLGKRLTKERQSDWKNWVSDLDKVASRRSELETYLSYRPHSVGFAAKVLDEQKCPDYIRRTYRLRINPDDETEAVLYLPRSARASTPVPVIIGLHEHGGQFLLGKDKLCSSRFWPRTFHRKVFQKYQMLCYGNQPPAEYFAANGFAVFSIDQIGFGTRAIWQDEDQPYLNGERLFTAAIELRIRLRMRYEQFALHRALLTHGITEAEIALYDNRRSVDFLETISEVDSTRIGAFGLSMGCMHAHELAAFEPRVKATVRACWTGDFDTMLEANGPRALGTHFLLPGIMHKCHLPELIALSAPGAVLILNGKGDAMYPFIAQEKMRRTVQRMAVLQNRKNLLRWQYFDGPHSFYPPEQQTALQFFQEFL